MAPISVTIIARDEADRIGEAIASVGFADEVLVVESGSSDGTADVARAAGARVVQLDWPGHTAQKQRALELASHEWVLSLDADERVDPALAAEICDLALDETTMRGFTVRRRTWWQGAPISWGTWSPDRRVRLFRRDSARHRGPDPHDQVVVDGPVGALDGVLHHHAYRDLADHLNTIARYSEIFVEESHQLGIHARWVDILVRPPAHLFKALVVKQGWRDGVRGLCIAGLGASAVLLKWGLLKLRAAADGDVQ